MNNPDVSVTVNMDIAADLHPRSFFDISINGNFVGQQINLAQAEALLACLTKAIDIAKRGGNE